jgi:NAD(P)H-dependent FMN reductase/ketosteroid isomerase-like protein
VQKAYFSVFPKLMRAEMDLNMSQKIKVAVIVGSLRAASLSLKVAKALMARAPSQLDCELVPIGDLPLYNEELDGSPPQAWTRFRDAVRACQAVLFVTPEYNRSIPGCLKNALDVGSRPQGESIWDGLAAGVVSVTPYKLGAFGANHALRQTFVFLNLLVMQQPEAYIGGAGELFDDRGELKNAETATFLQKFMASFGQWTGTIRGENDSRHFGHFMDERDNAALAYVNGDAAPLDTLVTANDPATFFHPMGDRVEGAKAVQQRYDADVKSFAKGGSSRLEVLQQEASGDLAFWTGLQHADAILGGKKVPMTLRVTEIFRFEHGGWKLVHRHGDMPKGQ